MDHPITNRCMTQIIKKPLNQYERVHNALLKDDKDEFLKLIKEPGFKKEELDAYKIFDYDALNIATAVVIDGEADGMIYLDDKDLQTPLLIAASYGAPRFTNYLIERGHNVDFMCNYDALNLKHVTLIDLVVETIESGLLLGFHGRRRPWTPRKSIYELLVYVCDFQRAFLEVVRLLVQNTQHKDRVKQTFIDYADKGKLVHLAVLFVAAPELFLSPFVLNSSEKRTDIQEGLSLLLDFFAVVGHKFVAYTRVEDPSVCELGHKVLFLLIRELAQKKQGVSSPDDYFLSFFKPVRPDVDQQVCPRKRRMSDYWRDVEYDGIMILPFHMKRKDIDMDYINKNLPILKPGDAAVLNRAIEKKLSSGFTLHNRFEDITRISKKRVKPPPQGFSILPSGRSFKPGMLTFCTSAIGANQRFHFKNTPSNNWENKAIKPNKLKSLFAAVKPSIFPMIIKRLIK